MEIMMNFVKMYWRINIFQKFLTINVLNIHVIVSSDQSQRFFFSSARFLHVPSDQLELINDTTVKLKHQMIKCNSIFGKLISDKIGTNHIVDFSTFEEKDILISLFDLLRGFPFNINQYDSKLFLNAINFLGFNSLFHILQLKEHPIITLPVISEIFLLVISINSI
jgi:hypothetical protein